MTASNVPALPSSDTLEQSIEEQTSRPLEDRDSVVERLRHLDLRQLPPPPTSGEAWRDRAMRLCEDMPGLRTNLISVPIGWFSLVEMAVAESRPLLPAGQRIRTSQMKEKFGTLRWYCHVEIKPDSWDYQSAALAAMDWAEEASSRVCAAFGTPDGEPDRTAGWVLTLSPLARQLRKSTTVTQGIDLAEIMYPPWADT